jgi:hypothetical protein
MIPITETRKLNATNTTVATQHVGVGVVGVWQFDLPSAYAEKPNNRIR